MRNLLLVLLAAASGLAGAATTREIEGTWKYQDADDFFQVRLEHGGECLLSASTSSSDSAYMVHCIYVLHWPRVDVTWIGDDEGNPASLRLYLGAGGDLMRVDGEPRRPLVRVPHEHWPLPRTNLSETGAMSANERYVVHIPAAAPTDPSPAGMR